MKKTNKKHKETRRVFFDGLPVVDAEEDIALVIKPVDVRKSTRKNPDSCAAALAGRRELKRDVKVFLSRMYVKEKNYWVRYLTPGNVSREIVAFDRGSAFEPGEYVFKAPTEGQKLGHYYSPNKTSGSNKRNPRAVRHATANIRAHAKSEYHK